MICLLVVAPLAALAAGQYVEDGRGFGFEVPDGFEPFPGFERTPAPAGPGKLYAFGKALGSPSAVVVALDAVAGVQPGTTGSPSCQQLALDIARTTAAPLVESWNGQELTGLRMVMSHAFGEVLVFCVDVPLTPDAVSVRVSGKPANEVLLRETFRSLLATVALTRAPPQSPSGLKVLGAVVLASLLGVAWRWARRRRA